MSDEAKIEAIDAENAALAAAGFTPEQIASLSEDERASLLAHPHADAAPTEEPKSETPSAEEPTPSSEAKPDPAPAVAEADAAAPPTEPEAPRPAIKLTAPLPVRISFDAPYGFYDDDGRYRGWNAGNVVTDPEQIALLVERQDPHRIIE